MKNEISKLLKAEGVSDIGFCKTDDGPLPYAISIVVRLSDAVVDEINTEPTITYFHHYRTVNAFIDRCLLKLGLYLQDKGYKYIPVGASQSDPQKNYAGRYSHKKAAVLSGLGFIGKNSMFIHKDFGPRVRLGTIFTDYPFEYENIIIENGCKGCNLCVKACPSGAILGGEWKHGTERSEIFDPELCSNYMKKEFQHIGRGAVCGICMKVCPYNK